jgi:putative ABC transport system permease protein
MPLNHEHIGYIIKDLHYRGLVLEGLRDEVIDHVCTATEAGMESGKNFIEAYSEVLESFGNSSGLHETQKLTLNSENTNTKIMIRNYFTIAWRNLKKHQFYTFINIAGLATGVAACLIIVLFVLHELSYDRHHANASRIYRVNGEIKYADNHWKLAVAPAPLAEALLQDYPEIQEAVRFRGQGSYLVRRTEADVNIKEERVIWVDNSFFKIFSVPVIEGNAATALAEPNAIAISKKTAAKYFLQFMKI